MKICILAHFNFVQKKLEYVMVMQKFELSNLDKIKGIGLFHSSFFQWSMSMISRKVRLFTTCVIYYATSADYNVNENTTYCMKYDDIGNTIYTIVLVYIRKF
jgi:hypothetical protein